MAISRVITTSINQFIDWSLLITLILIFYYLLMTIFHSDKKDEEAPSDASELIEKVKGMAADKKDKDKVKKERALAEHERKKREDKIHSITSPLINAINDGRDVINTLAGGRGSEKNRSNKINNAKRHLNSMTREIKTATNRAKIALRSEKKSHEAHNFFDSIYRNCGVALHEIEGIEIPEHDDPDWKENVKEASGDVEHVRGICGAIVKRLMDYLKNPSDLTALDSQSFRDRRGRGKSSAASPAESLVGELHPDEPETEDNE